VDRLEIDIVCRDIEPTIGQSQPKWKAGMAASSDDDDPIMHIGLVRHGTPAT
jgi:hypothetical protein